MDDLISRKAVADILTNPAYEYSPKIERAIVNLPSVPAVPLDTLCELLAQHLGSPCFLCKDEEFPNCDGLNISNIWCWHYALIKWMEGLDDPD